ncbi:family 43 glycosylhydrolase [Mucilaginibacter pallidiroseus]|uniref:Family 43 glycosylhydrolase n=1 Tax=Mucilaginibacter pallidiroseus TaxID=2599295 RepID=A0A563UIF5_9SPHI|nr:family 43 glycosylhydrolase [Mucilaginibacter pallidiroseus]TWR31121.1 family 43 glycosylhydrolase [Mucilaginibacter pallidiroseus]
MKTLSRQIAQFLTLFLIVTLSDPASAQIKNFDKNGKQVTRFSTTGDAIDAHDGEIAHFNGTYYLYGTSYDCGFQWGNKGAPFCGFKVYSSKDLSTWTDRGYLFNAKTDVWQSHCDGKTYGCFRPHVVYNSKTKKYVLWINVYDNVVGYRVFTSSSPVGPFAEVAEPKLAVNSTMPAAGLNNGDHDTFIDDDGTAYLAYTDWRTEGTIVIEKLSADYLTGTGEHVKAVTNGKTEAPGMFKRNGIYYVVYSDPNCGYCSGTGSSYRTAKSPLGPWSEGKKISDNSCGGQPSFVSTIKIDSETVYLYGSDLWNNAAKNEALANYYWAPLTFAADGSINPLVCGETYAKPKALTPFAKPGIDNTTGTENFNWIGDINSTTKRSQSFTASRTGKLSKASITVFKNNNPDGNLEISIYAADDNGLPIGKSRYNKAFPENNIGWSPKNVMINPNLRLVKGRQYALVLSTASTKGQYGVEASELTNFKGGVSAKSAGNDKPFIIEKGQALKFETFITAGK